MSVQELALFVAAEEHDKYAAREVPRGSNYGGRVTLYLNGCGMFKPAYWCAAFVTWCIVRPLTGGVFGKNTPPLPGCLSTCSWQEWARIRKTLYTLGVRGDLFVICDPGKWQGHMGFICEVKEKNGWRPALWDRGDGKKVLVVKPGLYYRTIEGNSNDDGSRNGWKVVRRWRSVAGTKAIRYA